MKHATVFRVDVRHSITIAVAERPVFGCEFTLSSLLPVRKEIYIQPDDVLGWANHNWQQYFHLVPYYPDSPSGITRFSSLFTAKDGCFHSVKPLSVYILGDTPAVLHQYGLLIVRPR